jgi:Ca2+:H+ antiporter
LIISVYKVKQFLAHDVILKQVFVIEFILLSFLRQASLHALRFATPPLFLLTLLTHFFFGETVAFILACLTLGGLSALIGLAIEDIGLHYSLSLTSSLQAALGSIPLALVVIFTLVQGKAEVAQMIIVGAILANGLLVLGLTFISGALANGKTLFDKRISTESSILFIMAVMAMAFTGAAASSIKNAPEGSLYLISVLISLILLVAYGVWLYEHIKSSPVIREDRPPAKETLRSSGVTIVLATMASALVAWWITENIDPVVEAFNLSPLFVGAILFPLIASAAGNTSAISLVRNGHPKLAVALVQGSIAHITAFLFPLLVLLSYFLDTRLTLVTSALFVTALGISGLVIRQISNDGEATLFEGAALVGSFFILAILAYFASL